MRKLCSKDRIKKLRRNNEIVNFCISGSPANSENCRTGILHRDDGNPVQDSTLSNLHNSQYYLKRSIEFT